MFKSFSVDGPVDKKYSFILDYPMVTADLEIFPHYPFSVFNG